MQLGFNILLLSLQLVCNQGNHSKGSYNYMSHVEAFATGINLNQAIQGGDSEIKVTSEPLEVNNQESTLQFDL